MGQGRIVHTAVTDSPNLFWLVQQFRNATPYDNVPKYIIHDNDPVFKSRNFKKLLDDSCVTAITTGKEAPWQNPYAERVIGSIRRELLDYVVPMNERHLKRCSKSTSPSTTIPTVHIKDSVAPHPFHTLRIRQQRWLILRSWQHLCLMGSIIPWKKPVN